MGWENGVKSGKESVRTMRRRNPRLIQRSPKLTWDDLFFQDQRLDFERIFSCWPQIGGRVRPIGLSAFGGAFFAKPDESVWVLDAFSGEVRMVSAFQSEFAANMNSQPWQERNLRSELVLALRERGTERGPLQVFAPVPHPAQVGAAPIELR